MAVIKAIAAAILAAPLIGIGGWYAVSFLPHLSELKSLAAQGEAATDRVRATFYPLAVASETRRGIRLYAVRQAYYFLAFEKSSGQPLSWHANTMLWWEASYIHLSDDEAFGIWVECAHGCGHGLKEMARKTFGKELGSLSERELAGLVALLRNPTTYAPGTERGERRTDEILEKAKPAPFPAP